METFIIILLLIYEFIIYPKIVEHAVDQYIQALDGYVVNIKSLSRRDAIYLVEYMIEGKKLRNNVRCNLFGQIKEWI